MESKLMYNIGLVSLGCAKNQTDAEIMLGILANDGFNITYNPSADVVTRMSHNFKRSPSQRFIEIEYFSFFKLHLLSLHL